MRNVIFSGEQRDFQTQKFSSNLFSPIELFHCHIFRDKISLIGEAQGGKNQVELELPALLPLVRTEVIEFRMSYRDVFNHSQFYEMWIYEAINLAVELQSQESLQNILAVRLYKKNVGNLCIFL